MYIVSINFFVFQGMEHKPEDKEVKVIMKRTAMPLNENEGVYVRDIKTEMVCTCILQFYGKILFNDLL